MLVGRENVWLPFTIWSTALNAVLCGWVVGPNALSAVYSEVSPRDLGLVCTFSFLWGSGSACFSLGIQLVGEGIPSCSCGLLSSAKRFREQVLITVECGATATVCTCCYNRGGGIPSGMLLLVPHFARSRSLHPQHD